jgi:hypothetical protein
MFSEHMFSDHHPLIGTFVFQSGPTAAPLVWKQQGLALVGDAEGSGLGYLAALSKDTRTLVMGAQYYNNYTGCVKVYCTNNNGGNRDDGQKTPHGHADFDSYIKILRVLVCITDEQTDRQTDRQTFISISCGLPSHSTQELYQVVYVEQIHPLRMGWWNFFSAVLEKFLQLISSPWVYGT